MNIPQNNQQSESSTPAVCEKESITVEIDDKKKDFILVKSNFKSYQVYSIDIYG